MLVRHFLYLLLILSIVFACPVVANAEVEKAELAKKAKAILETHCYACHGKDGADEGGFDVVLDQPRLLATKMVISGNPKDSQLYNKILDGKMPPAKVKRRLTMEEIGVIKKWIEDGALDFNPPAKERAFISNFDVLKLIRKDLEKAKQADENSAPLLRYFTLTHLHNAGLSRDELNSYRAGLSKLVNSLSWGQEIVLPQAIEGSEETILRINLKDYNWNEKTWERILAANPYGITYKGENATYCYQETKSTIPHVRADWFVFAASRPPLYHDILRLPATVEELEKLVLPLGSSVAENIRLKKVVRAAFNGPTGVSNNNRVMERHDSSDQGGYYWKTHDFEQRLVVENGKEVDHPERSVFEHPLGPDGPNAFQHGGGEMIFSLHNGLQGYYLSDAKGNRLNEGPIKIVSDPDQKDRAVINGISCMKCHNLGLKEKFDEVRSFVLANPNAFRGEERKAILALYKEKSDLERRFKQDMKRFRDAVELTGAKLTDTEPIYVLAKKFESNLDLNLAAAEVGVSVRQFEDGLAKNDALARKFGVLRAGGRIKRDDLVAGFGDLIDELEPDAMFQQGNAALPSSFTPIDPDTIARYEKRGATYVILFPQGQLLDGLPGFRFGDSSGSQLSNLPPVSVTFGINLGNTQVRDEDLQALTALANLRHLDLSGTEISDLGLKEIANLNSLTSLDLSSTKVTDAGMKEIKNLKNITWLNLSRTKLTGAGLEELKNLNNLTSLDLSHTHVTNDGAKELRNLKSLVNLSLRNTRVTGDCLKDLNTLEKLSKLVLSSNHSMKGDVHLRDLRNLKNLTSLEIGGTATEVTDASLNDVGAFKNLTQLSLTGSKVRDEGLKNLAGLKGLTSIVLGGENVTDAGLKGLNDLKNLTRLILYQTSVTDAGIKELQNLKSLAVLDLRGTKVTDAGLKELAGFRNLRSLHLNGDEITDGGMKEIKNLKNLTFLNLRYSKVTDVGLKELAGLKKLTSLDLSDTAVTSTGLNYLKDLNRLVSLELGTTTITDEDLKALRHLNNLTHLSLYRTQVSDDGLKQLENLKHLTSLDLGANYNITDTGLKQLKHLSNLTELRLEFLKVSNLGLRELKELKNLTILGLSHIPIPDNRIVSELREALPKCRIERR